LRGIESGARGDLLCEWVRFDTDKDGVAETKWPRLRLVRPLSAGGVGRVSARTASSADAPDGAAPVPSAGLSEVIWLVAPAATEAASGRAEGRLWRGERLSAETTTKSFFADGFLGPSNQPPGGVTEEVSDGILWLHWMFAAPSSIVKDGWAHTAGPDGVASSWDAWSRSRPSAEIHYFNSAMQPASAASELERPHLPRRIRIEIEIERAADRIRRTIVSAAFGPEESAFRADDPGKIPREEGACVLIDAEWMRVSSVDGSSVVVARAQRGTQKAHHDRGAMVHYGVRLVREVPVVAATQEWKP
jgi:hypothetical protein